MEVMADNYRKTNFPIRAKIPLPVIGSFIHSTKTTGASPQDIQNKQYTAYVKRIKTLLKMNNGV
jgi:hypothetical protein